MLLEEHFEELRDLVTLENGKDAKDAGGEVRRGIEVVEFACGMPTLLMGETVRDVARGVDNASYRYPLGVVAAITDRKSTRLNSSHANISYAVFCLKKKKN